MEQEIKNIYKHVCFVYNNVIDFVFNRKIGFRGGEYENKNHSLTFGSIDAVCDASNIFLPETSALSMSVEFNGKQISVSPSPVLSETGEVLVPLKQIFELLNATVTWHAENETLSVYSKDGMKTTLSAECLTANIHGTATLLPSKPVMLNDTLYGQLNILSGS